MRVFTILVAAVALLVPLAAAQPRTVGVLVYTGMEILDFAGPTEVFVQAGELAGAGERGFKVVTVGRDREPAVSMDCLDVLPDHDLASCPKLDVLVIPGGSTTGLMNDEKLHAWIAARAKTADVTLTVCTGSFVAGAAGILDGKEATTHWAGLPLMKWRFPEVKVKSARRFVDAGPVVTSGGVSAGIDAAMHVVARLENRGLAIKVARAMRHRWNRKGIAPDGITGTPEEGRNLVRRALDKADAPESKPREVMIRVKDGMRLIDVAAPAEVYRSVKGGRAWRVLTSGDQKGEIVTCSGVRLRTRNGPPGDGAVLVAANGLPGIDEALDAVTRRFGRDEAERTARVMEYPWRSMVERIELDRITKEVKDLNAAMSAAFKRGDMKAVAAFYADDTILMSPGGDRVEGRKAVVEYWTRITDGHEWRLDVKSVEGRKGLAVQRGTSHLVRKNPDGTLRTSVVEFMLVWVRGKDGKLRISVDAYW